MTIDRLAGPAPDIPLLRISGPADLLQAVPYLLGFHPQSSLVIIGLDQSRLVVTVRLDLADLDTRDVLGDAVTAMHRGGATELVAAIYDAGPRRRGRPLPWDAAVASFVAEAARVDCAVIDVLVVVGDRWWSYACSDTECCPTEGRQLPDDVSAFSAAATYAGMVALPDRDALAAVLDPLPDAERDRLWPLLADYENAAVQAVLDGHGPRHDRSVKRALFAAARRSDAPADPSQRLEITDSDVARFGVALSAPALRDSLWMAADDGRLDGRCCGSTSPGACPARTTPLRCSCTAGARGGRATVRWPVSRPSARWPATPPTAPPICCWPPWPAAWTRGGCPNCVCPARHDPRRAQNDTACGATGSGRSEAPVSSPSTAAAQARPSAMAHTTSEAPRLASPQAYTPSADVRQRSSTSAVPRSRIALHAERIEQFGHVGADEAGGEQHQRGRQFGARAGHRAELAPAVDPHDLDLLDDDGAHRAARVADELDHLARPRLVHALVVGGRDAAVLGADGQTGLIRSCAPPGRGLWSRTVTDNAR